jgi:hypothetical protein
MATRKPAVTRRRAPQSQNARKSGASATVAKPELEQKHLEHLHALKGQRGVALADAHDEALAATATLAAITEEAGAFFAERGLLDSRGRPRLGAHMYLRAHSKLMKSLDALGLTPMSQSALGIRIAQIDALGHKQVKPVRTRSRAVEVAGLLQQFGVLPTGSAEPVDADVIEDVTPTEEPEPEPDPTPPKLSEEARRSLGVRHIFDR